MPGIEEFGLELGAASILFGGGFQIAESEIAIGVVEKLLDFGRDGGTSRLN